MNLKKVHFISGIAIFIFVALHLINHLGSLFGAEQHISLMNDLRVFYRNTIIETILLIAVFTQVITGVKLFLKKRKTANSFFEKLQIWSGLYLAIFFAIHLSAVLGGRLVLDLDTNFYFGVAGLNTFPFYLFFAPYYGLAIMAFFGHLAAIHFQKMKKSIFGFTPKQQANFILIKGIILTIIIFYGLTNGFNGVEIPSEYNVLIGK